MRFHLLDRITSCEPGQSLRGVKRLTLGEEYLHDHFPGFPIMPGVLQLQSLVEAASWLLRISDEFQHAVVVLREVKNVKYGNLMQPGKSLEVTVELAGRDGPTASFKGKGETGGTQTVAAQFTLACYNLRERNPALQPIDEGLVAQLRSHCLLLRGEVRAS
jgi:3-hydroxyacyl-[acyl-carrier-protein] dehydratase